MTSHVSNMKPLDRLQVAAFHAAYKSGTEYDNNQRFVNAVCKTSDEKFKMAIKINPKLVNLWLDKYGLKHKRGRDANKLKKLHTNA